MHYYNSIVFTFKAFPHKHQETPPPSLNSLILSSHLSLLRPCPWLHPKLEPQWRRSPPTVISSAPPELLSKVMQTTTPSPPPSPLGPHFSQAHLFCFGVRRSAYSSCSATNRAPEIQRRAHTRAPERGGQGLCQICGRGGAGVEEKCCAGGEGGGGEIP